MRSGRRCCTALQEFVARTFEGPLHGKMGPCNGFCPTRPHPLESLPRGEGVLFHSKRVLFSGAALAPGRGWGPRRDPR